MGEEEDMGDVEEMIARPHLKQEDAVECWQVDEDGNEILDEWGANIPCPPEEDMGEEDMEEEEEDMADDMEEIPEVPSYGWT